VVNGCTHCTPENTHWTPGIIASNGCAGATPAHPAQTSGAHDSGAYPRRDAPAPQELPRAQGGLQPAPSPVSGIRTPKRPLLPVWEKGVGGMRGQTCTRGRDARAPGANLRCAHLRRIPPQRRSSPAGASTRSGRASARTLSRFRHQDAQTPPSPRVGEGGREDEGANAHTRARRPRT
jgi:hypothetical protein